MTIQEFGAKIKLKYPQYSNLSDEELANKMLAKYPQYKNQVEQPKQEKPSLFKRAASFVGKDVFGGGVKEKTNLAGDIFRSTLGSKGLAGVAQMPGKIIGQTGVLKDQTELSESLGGLADVTNKLIKNLDTVKDPEAKLKLTNIINSNLEMLGEGKITEQETEKEIVTPKEVISTTANAVLTTLTGSGLAAKNLAMRGAKALPVGSKLASNVYKASTFGKGLLPRALEFGGISAGFQASTNLAENKPLSQGTGLAFGVGTAFPFAGTATSKVISQIPGAKLKTAERVVNSMIKPLLKDFSYGKNPGRGVAREGLVFNTLAEGEVKITERLRTIGSQINQIGQKYKNETLDLSNVLSPIDEAIEKAGFAPRTNSTLLARLQDAKNDILQVTTDLRGKNIIGRDLSNLTFQEAIELKRLIGDITKFTGNASDDALVNSSLKRIYGKVKEQINNIAPEMKTFNERWADLKSAQIAIRYRDKIQARQNLVGIAPKISGMLLGGTGVITLNPALVAGAFLTYGADTLLSSPAFKTRLAAWLAKSSVKERNQLIRNLPVFKNVLDRIFGDNNKKSLNKKEIEKLLGEIPAGLSIKDVSGKVKVKVNGKDEIMDVVDYKNWSRKWDEDGTPYEFIERVGKIKGAIPSTMDDLTSQISKAKAEGKSFEEWVVSEMNKKPKYGMSHRPTFEDAPPAYNLLEGDMLPRDVYTKPEWSIASGRSFKTDKSAQESWEAIQKIKGKPDGEITVYRASPKNELNSGDWVTFSKSYAEEEGAYEGSKVFAHKVKAKDIFFAGDDINEFGYFPKSQLKSMWNKVNP